MWLGAVPGGGGDAEGVSKSPIIREGAQPNHFFLWIRK